MSWQSSLQGGPVKVQGKSGSLNAEDINEWWETKSYPQWACNEATIPRGIQRLETGEGKKKGLEKEKRAKRRASVEAATTEQQEEGFNIGTEPDTKPERHAPRRSAGHF
ncbi:hypothetical protein Ddye_026264 [Dipteronia dyeriana]|uniref:Uncharacterized protein n=1 Tax=Dipteronia dyeriana TaxID=168575 RepID=A0AAD9TLU9_9ROSI|nr:hypothetical protein Ddye_026264 [Dipteronia dyeriana]